MPRGRSSARVRRKTRSWRSSPPSSPREGHTANPNPEAIALHTAIRTVFASILFHIPALAVVRHKVRNDHTEASRSMKARQSPGTQAPYPRFEAVVLDWLVLAALHGHHQAMIPPSRTNASLLTGKGCAPGRAAQIVKGIYLSHAANPGRGYRNNIKDAPLTTLQVA
jgi:hypothetical protein